MLMNWMWDIREREGSRMTLRFLTEQLKEWNCWHGEEYYVRAGLGDISLGRWGYAVITKSYKVSRSIWQGQRNIWWVLLAGNWAVRVPRGSLSFITGHPWAQRLRAVSLWGSGWEVMPRHCLHILLVTASHNSRRYSREEYTDSVSCGKQSPKQYSHFQFTTFNMYYLIPDFFYSTLYLQDTWYCVHY